MHEEGAASHDQDESNSQRGWTIELRGVEAIEPLYANHLTASYDLYACQLAFSQLITPIFESEAARQKFAESGIWEAEVMARILIPPEALRLMIEYLQDLLNRYDSQYNPSAHVHEEEKAAG